MSKAKQAALQREQKLQEKAIGLHRLKCRCSRCNEKRTRSIESFNAWIGVLFDAEKRSKD